MTYLLLTHFTNLSATFYCGQKIQSFEAIFDSHTSPQVAVISNCSDLTETLKQGVSNLEQT